MKKITFLMFICTLLWLPLSTVQAESVENTAIHTISVQGNSSLTATPDQADISIGITTTAATANIAAQENAVIANDIQTNLAALGIAKDKIHTKNYTFYPTYNNNTTTDHANEITGYTADNTVSVTLDDIAMLSDVIDSSIKSGANKVNSINFTMKNPQDMQQKALQAAIKDAREKADSIAKALGKHVTNVVSVSENNSYIESRNFASFSLRKSDGLSTPIEPDEIHINSTVQVQFIMD